MEKFLNLFNRRTVAVLLLSFSSGLPLVLVGSTLQAWYTEAGVSIMTIGALTLVGQPYVYKFLWAPLFDRYNPLKFDRRRSWLFMMQFALVVGLIAMAFMDPKTMPWLLATTALLVATFSASQDIAFDAYRTDVLSVEERGLGSAFNTFGYRLAMLVAGAFALIMAAEWGWKITYLVMAGLMLLQMIITIISPTVEQTGSPKTLNDAVVLPFKDFLTRRNAILILIFIVIYKLSDALALSLNTYFLLHGLGFSLIEVGSVQKVALMVGTLLGGFVGGILLPRIGLYRALMIFGWMQISANLSFILLLMTQKSITLMGAIIFVDSFCSGLGSVAFVVFLMSLCNKRFTATQYALLSALSAVGRVFIGPQAALMVQHMGWTEFYIWSFIFGIPSLLILWWLNRRIDFKAEQLAQA